MCLVSSNGAVLDPVRIDRTLKQAGFSTVFFSRQKRTAYPPILWWLRQLMDVALVLSFGGRCTLVQKDAVRNLSASLQCCHCYHQQTVAELAKALQMVAHYFEASKHPSYRRPHPAYSS
jgi:hypothetical protein